MRSVLGASLLLISIMVAPAKAEPPLNVVASILPIHSLVSAVTHGVTTPALILPGYASPHLHQLRPSEARALHQADVVFWVGAGMETFLARSIDGLAPQAHVVSLMETPGVVMLENRPALDWTAQSNAEHDDDDAAPASPHAHALDAHIWLSPVNAKHLVREVVRVLSEVDTTNRGQYQNNGALTLARLDTLEKDLLKELIPVQTTPYVVFHDAYHYLEDHFDLNVLGAVTVNPDRPPSAKRVARLRRNIIAHRVRCVFVEPQFSRSWVKVLTEDGSLQVGVLDPLGATLNPGPEAYFALMRANAEALTDCLTP